MILDIKSSPTSEASGSQSKSSRLDWFRSCRETDLLKSSTSILINAIAIEQMLESGRCVCVRQRARQAQQVAGATLSDRRLRITAYYWHTNKE
mmetsp:Transcript_21949/g.48837  ORF Transcript_21949/g.48837 Transcript_21949/m.48837 type:complete len:93 (-) Transcript_21949:64-342(-)